MSAALTSSEPELDPTSDIAGQELATPQRTSRWRVAGVLTLIFGFAVWLMYAPTVGSMRRSLPWNLADPSLTTWVAAWGWHAFTTHPLGYFDANIFFPNTGAIGYSEMILPVVPLFGLVYAVTGNPVLAHNVSILALAFVCLTCTYLLAHRLTGRRDVAVVAAIAFSFSGFVFMHVGHLQLLTLGFFPLAFLALFRMFELRRPLDGVLLGGATFLLTSGCLYFGAIWSLCLVLIVGLELLRMRRDGRWRVLLAPLAAFAVATAVVLGPFAYAYASFQRKSGFVRAVSQDAGFKLADLFTPAAGTRLYDELLGWVSHIGDRTEHAFFPGFVVLALAGYAAVTLSLDWRARRADRRDVLAPPTEVADDPATSKRRELWYLVLAGGVSLVVALGPEVFGIPMPFKILRAVVPGFDGTKAIARFAVPLLLVLAVLAAIGLDRLLKSAGQPARTVAIAAVVLVMLAEYAVHPLRAHVDESNREVYAALRHEPAAPVVELPITADPFVEGERLLASIGDWRPRVNGFSGAWPRGFVEQMPTLNQFPADDSVGLLHRLGVRYVVLHVGDGASSSTLTEEQAAAVLQHLPPGATAHRYGTDYLVDLGPGN
jgi:hypothetical protein